MSALLKTNKLPTGKNGKLIQSHAARNAARSFIRKFGKGGSAARPLATSAAFASGTTTYRYESPQQRIRVSRKALTRGILLSLSTKQRAVLRAVRSHRIVKTFFARRRAGFGVGNPKPVQELLLVTPSRVRFAASCRRAL